jgi:hypothetical protein
MDLLRGETTQIVCMSKHEDGKPEGALVVANAKEKANAKKQLKPENAFALISDHTYTLHLGTVSSKYCRIYILYYYISI